MSYRSCEKYWVGLCNMSVQKLNNSTRLSCNEQYNIKKSLYELRKKSYSNLHLYKESKESKESKETNIVNKVNQLCQVDEKLEYK